MSQLVDPGCSEQIKNIIRHLYVVKGYQLQGPNGVMKLMEDRYGFKATKAQYERFFNEWGWSKKRKRDDYKVIGQKIKSRRTRGKDSDVYLDGELMPRKKIQKEISRQGYMTVSEQISQDHVTIPQTPPGFQIRTPSSQPLFRLIFHNLPILRYQEEAQSFNKSIKEFDAGLTSLGPLLGKTQNDNTPGPIFSFINSVLPNSALLDEGTASGLAVERIEQVGTVEFLNLMTFLISNNLPGEASGEDIYKWIKDHGSNSILRELSTMEGPTAKSLLENLFRLAVEAGDTPSAKYLLQAGVNPNGHKCRNRRIPDTLDPLQLACIMGKSDMAQELIKAGADINEASSGWKRSILVLAIIGNFWEGEEKLERISSENEDDSKERSDALINLIDALIDAGASINIEDIDSYRETNSPRDEDGSDDMVELDDLPFALEDGHSPLTAASKYRHKSLVDLLIRKGADVNFRTAGGASALQECLYSWEEMNSNINEGRWWLKPVFAHQSFLLRSLRESKVIAVAQSLLDAGADINNSACYEFPYAGGNSQVLTIQDLSALDLATLSANVEVVKMLLCAGANALEKHLALAVDSGEITIFELLLNANAPIPDLIFEKVVDTHLYADMAESHSWLKLLLEKRPDLRTRRIAVTTAIWFGSIAMIDDLLGSGTSDLGIIFSDPSTLNSSIRGSCFRGHIGILRRILEGVPMTQSLRVSSIGDGLRATLRCNRSSEIVNFLLSAGADMNAITPPYKPTLLEAIRERDKAMVERLLSAGAAVDAKAHCGLYDVMYHKPAGATLIAAIEWGDFTVIENLIKAGADINAAGPSNPSYSSKHKCECRTPLTAAILKGNWTLIKYLVNAGASLHNPPDLHTGCTTSLAAAVSLHDIEIIQFLLEAGINPEDELALVIATKNIQTLWFLLSALSSRSGRQGVSNVARHALAEVIQTGDIAAVELIIASQLVDINSVYDNSTVLMEALSGNPSSRFEIVRIILGAGADPNGIVVGGISPAKSALLLAIPYGNSRNVELLLQAGAEPDRSLIPGMEFTALQCAAWYSGWEDKGIVRMLLDYGADPDTASPYGDTGTPIQLAAQDKHLWLVKILLEYKANPDAVAVNVSHTALQIAARNGCKEMVELLIEHGANVNSPPAEDSGATAFQFAVIGGFLGIAYLLLENGADVNAAPAAINGRTALEGAAEHGRIDTLQLLLNAGAEIHGDGRRQYERALRFASRNGHHATRELLESYHG